MTKHFLAILIAIFITAVFGISYLISGLDFFSEEGNVAFSSTFPEYEKWQSRIDTVGSEQAYEEYKEEYTPRSFKIQHITAHLIGELLYENEGIKGLVICDEAFAFGCYHSFFGRAISENGVGIVSELDRACLEKYGAIGTGCQHGIGHGILEYMGHNKLVAALETCEMTTQANPLFGCTSGVFMEYNIPVIISEKEIYADIREPVKGNLYAPCNTIAPERFKRSCYFELVEWWSHVLNKDFQEIGRMCERVPGESYREGCYLNIGNIGVSSNDYNLENIINICKKMPHSEGKTLCRIGAAWRLFGIEKHRELGDELCQNTDKNLKYKCYQ